MTFTVTWHVPNRLYLVRIAGDLTLDELRDGLERTRAFVRAGEPPVHTIIDLRQLGSQPRNLPEIIKASSVLREPNLGWVMILSNDPFSQFVASVVSQITGARFKIFQDSAAVIEHLKQVDSTLPAIPTIDATA